MNLIIVEPDEISSSGGVMLAGARGAHLVRVLNVAPGDRVRIGLLNGARGVGTVKAIGEMDVQLQCEFEPAAPARPRVDVLLALPRPKVLRRLWAQLAALGVGRIMLTNAARVERNYFDTHVLRSECYRPLLIEGLQQARDTWLPEVSVHRQLKVLMEDHLGALSPCGIRLVAEPSARRPDARTFRDGKGERILVAIGPEGGWNSYELGLLEAHRFQPMGMGPRTLRADTACIAMVSLIHAMESDGSE